MTQSIVSGVTHAINFNSIPKALIFHLGTDQGQREVLRITAEGELVFADPTEAATTLKREWDRIMGRP